MEKWCLINYGYQNLPQYKQHYNIYTLFGYTKLKYYELKLLI